MIKEPYKFLAYWWCHKEYSK